MSTRARGRPPADHPAVTRQQVIEAAARTLGRQGYRGTTLRGLADELGVSLGTIQHHIANKESLWRAVVDEVLMDRVERAIAAAASAGGAGGPEAALRAMLTSRIQDALSTPGLLPLVLGDGSAEDRERLRHLATAIEEPRARGVELFRGAGEAGLLSDADPAAFMALVNLGLVAVVSSPEALRVLFGVDLGDPAARDRFIEHLIDIVVRGVLPRP